MHLIYLLSVWLHIIAAVVWIGGTIFLAGVLLPAIRRPEFAQVGVPLIRATAHRFRFVGWLCFGVFVLTGSVNLWFRGIGWTELQSGHFWQGSFGTALASKLILVAVIISLSALHDFFIGPRAAAMHGKPIPARRILCGCADRRSKSRVSTCCWRCWQAFWVWVSCAACPGEIFQ